MGFQHNRNHAKKSTRVEPFVLTQVRGRFHREHFLIATDPLIPVLRILRFGFVSLISQWYSFQLMFSLNLANTTSIF